MNRLAVLAALSAELEPVLSLIRNDDSALWGSTVVHRGHIGSQEVIALASGVGKVGAASASQFVIDRHRPSAVLFIGAAGALDPGLGSGHVVIGARVVEHDFDIKAFSRQESWELRSWDGDPALLEAGLRAAARVVGSERARLGTILTGDQVVTDAGRRNHLRESLAGDCIEMLEPLDPPPERSAEQGDQPVPRDGDRGRFISF